jgi:hypothetical protein
MTATRCRPPTLRDLSTELTFEVADFCSGSIAPFRPSARHFRSTPNNGHQQTGPVGPFGAISGREQCDPGQSILVAPIAGRYDEAGDRDRVAIAGARWDL